MRTTTGVAAWMLVATAGLAVAQHASMPDEPAVEAALEVAEPAPAAEAAAEPVSDPAAQAVLDRLVARYKGARTYRDRAVMTQTITMGGASPEPMRMVVDASTAYAFDRGGRVSLAGPGGLIVSDGTTLWRTSASGEQYTEEKAPASLDEIEFGEQTGMMGMTAFSPDDHPVLGMLMEGKALAGEWFGGVETATSLRREVRDGREHEVITSAMRPNPDMMMGMLPEGEPLPPMDVEMWVDAETGLLRLVAIDATATTRAMWGGMGVGSMMPRVEGVTMTFDLRGAEIDVELPRSAFAFDTAGREKVDELGFDMDFGMGDTVESVKGLEFIHVAAPAFEAKTMSGEVISNESLKGSVVLLDFWATWCGPCVEAIPSIQALSDEYKERGLVVIGINQDMAGMTDEVRAFLEEKKITFAQVLDADNTIGDLFDVSAIPTTVLIDREGVVQSYGVGFHGKDAYAEKISAVLAGEQLEKPEPPPSPLEGMAMVNPDAAKVQISSAPVSGWTAQRSPTRDGSVVMLSDNGGLTRLDPAKGTFEAISLEGMDGSKPVTAFTPITERTEAGEGTGWAIACTDGWGEGDQQIVAFAADGRRRWSTPIGVQTEGGAYFDTRLAAADMTGDGRPEVIVFTSVMTPTSHEPEVLLVVLGDDGSVQMRRTVELDGVGSLEVVPASGGKLGRCVLIGHSHMAVVDIGL